MSQIATSKALYQGGEKIHHDDDSTDAVIKKVVYLENERKYNSILRIQLKCTSSPIQCADKGDHLIYKLNVKNYNELCMEGTSDIILALLVLPEDESEWLTWTQEDLLIKGCMYWASFVSQKLETLNTIMDKIAREKWPCDIQ